MSWKVRKASHTSTMRRGLSSGSPPKNCTLSTALNAAAAQRTAPKAISRDIEQAG